ncbi:MAG: hypothetical protein J6V74_02275, partial [Bacteroidales bacterium]|nr:hypothetical protein [Bacteroidales bacterium]
MRRVLLSLVMAFSVVFAMAETPTITAVNGDTSFDVDVEYQFQATADAQMFGWTVEGESTGYEILEGSDISSLLKIKFSIAGTYILKCTTMDAQGNPSDPGIFEVVVGGVTQQGITYTVPEQFTICRGGDMTYYVVGSEEITSELTLVVGLESFTGSSKEVEGEDNQTYYFYEFDLSGMTPTSGTFSAEVMENGEKVASGTITLADTPEEPTITSTAQTFVTGEVYTFTAESQSVVDEYLWVMTQSVGANPHDGYEFIGDSTSSSVQVKFNKVGPFILLCQEYNNGCGPVFGEISVEVEGGSSSQYTFESIPNATYCFYDTEKTYRIKATSDITGASFTITDDQTQTAIQGVVSGNEVVFDLSAFTFDGGSQTTITDGEGNTIGTPYITMTTSGPWIRIALWTQDPVVGQQVYFVDEGNNNSGNNTWSVVDGDNSYTIDNHGSSAYFTFTKAGEYTVKCEGYYGSSECMGSDTYGFTVSEGATQQDISEETCMNLYDYSGTERWEYYANLTNLPVEVAKEGSKNDKVLYFNATADERLTYALDLENDDDYATWMNILGSEDSRLVGRIYVETLGTDADGLALFLLSGDVSGGPSYHEKNAAFPITGLQTGQWFEFDIPLSTNNGWYYNTYSSTNEYKALWLSTYKGSEETLGAFKIYVDYLRICEKPLEVVAKSGKVSYDGSQVELKFTAPMSVPTSTSAITIKEGTETHTITSIQAKDGDQTVLIFNLETPISNASATITASISESTSAVKSIDG